MERIYITSSDDYYLMAPNDTKKYTLIDLYNNRKSINGYPPHISFKLYVKENGKYVDKNYFDHRLNYKNIANYTLDEIISIHKLSIFTLFKYYQCNKLEKPINIKGKCYFKENHNDYYGLVEYYWKLCETYVTKPTTHLMYNDVVYNLSYSENSSSKYVDIHINGKYILEYTSSELSAIVDSQNYIIGSNSTLPDEVFQEVITPQQFTLDDYYCNVVDGKLIVSTSLKEYYPCKNGVLELVINHHKPSGIIISKNSNNLIKLIEQLLKYDLSIAIV